MTAFSEISGKYLVNRNLVSADGKITRSAPNNHAFIFERHVAADIPTGNGYVSAHNSSMFVVLSPIKRPFLSVSDGFPFIAK